MPAFGIECYDTLYWCIADRIVPSDRTNMVYSKDEFIARKGVRADDTYQIRVSTCCKYNLWIHV